jgi:hypothetical protein
MNCHNCTNIITRNKLYCDDCKIPNKYEELISNCNDYILTESRDDEFYKKSRLCCIGDCMYLIKYGKYCPVCRISVRRCKNLNNKWLRLSEGLPVRTHNISKKNHLCKSTFCHTNGNIKYNGYCMFCYIHLFPNEPVYRNYKTKEKCIAGLISTHFPDKKWIFDKTINLNRRPDIFLDMDTYVIIIEIDEHQHRNNTTNCEQIRLNELFIDLNTRQVTTGNATRPIVCIRFNPDEYIDSDGNKIKSPWVPHGNTGILYIPKENILEWDNRTNVLLQRIQYWIINNPLNEPLTIEHLFFDKK